MYEYTEFCNFVKWLQGSADTKELADLYSNLCVERVLMASKHSPHLTFLYDPGWKKNLSPEMVKSDPENVRCMLRAMVLPGKYETVEDLTSDSEIGNMNRVKMPLKSSAANKKGSGGVEFENGMIIEPMSGVNFRKSEYNSYSVWKIKNGILPNHTGEPFELPRMGKRPNKGARGNRSGGGVDRRDSEEGKGPEFELLVENLLVLAIAIVRVFHSQMSYAANIAMSLLNALKANSPTKYKIALQACMDPNPLVVICLLLYSDHTSKQSEPLLSGDILNKWAGATDNTSAEQEFKTLLNHGADTRVKVRHDVTDFVSSNLSLSNDSEGDIREDLNAAKQFYSTVLSSNSTSSMKNIWEAETLEYWKTHPKRIMDYIRYIVSKFCETQGGSVEPIAVYARQLCSYICTCQDVFDLNSNFTIGKSLRSNLSKFLMSDSFMYI
ncbi:MAG TPA: hypothetical protein VFQ26_09145 [Nitrospiraceae bacterium]|nr:hypothetical protein [Nitrospiraceae bacterium]